MGKTAKKIKSEKRKMQKRAAKEAKKALYKSYSEQGKKKKKGNKKAGVSPARGNHYTTDCGNFGCDTCYPKNTRKIVNIDKTLAVA